MWKPSRALVQRQVRVAEHDRVGVREAPPQLPEPPCRGPAVVREHDPRARRLHEPHRGQPHPHRRLVHVAVNGVQRRAERLEQLEHLDRHEVAGVQDRVGGAEPRHACLRQRARASGHVRIADDRELQARQEGFEPPTSASGGQRSIH